MNKVARWLKKYFIPHEHNDHHPHFLRHESMLFMFLLIIIIELGFLAQVFLVFDKTKFLASVLPGVLVDLTNEERLEYGAGKLTVNPLLVSAAEMKANDMATKGYFAHTSPEGLTPWYWLGQVGYKYFSAGENLAVNFYDSEDVDRAWMNSPTHKANIIKAEYTEIGIGVARGIYQGRSTIFVAQFFGKPFTTSTPPAEETFVAVATPEKSSATEPNNTTTAKPKSTPIKTAPKIEQKPTEIQKTPENSTPVEPILVATIPVIPSTVSVLGEETPDNFSEDQTLVSTIKSYLNRAATTPSQEVAVVLSAIAILTLFVMGLVLFVRSEIKHPIALARGLALISVIILLLYVNVKVLAVDTLVPTEGVAESFIAY